VILSVVNGASFHPNGSPGGIATIFGLNLSDAIYQATEYPLPMRLGPTSVTVNGVPAPLFYVSPTQINFQMPGITPVGAPEVAVNTGLLRASSGGYPATVNVLDPGLFLDAGRVVAALKQDLSPITASTPVRPGDVVLLYITGQGPTDPAAADGLPAPASPLTLISGPVQVAIGGRLAEVLYAGLAPGFAGLSQINVRVPEGVGPGQQPVFVVISGAPSNGGFLPVQ